VSSTCSPQLNLVTVKVDVACYSERSEENYEGGPKNNRKLNVARELEVIARCATRYRESTQYSGSLPRGVSLV
jgi:hypothetical protein